ncbi:unnamed protein product [Aureobasidium vineae]|uniref:Uncharacterized protein n=1 Tax=Aureobasidium vineae TaxID=2773715 RepID=A0A9N8PHM4_9PEZI|nr:unnamed protein product [Aureobasidium vineae]
MHGHAISTRAKNPTRVDLSTSILNSRVPEHALAVSNLKAVKKEIDAPTTPCSQSDASASSTSSTSSCGQSDPCATGVTTETETHLATMTIQTTEMQTAYITDHKTTTQHTLQMVIKTVKEAGTTTVTSTEVGCSTVITTTTSMSLTTTINWHTAPKPSSEPPLPPPPPSSDCGSASCTVTTTKVTDIDMPTTAVKYAKISGQDIVQAVPEREMNKIFEKDHKKGIAGRDLQASAAVTSSAKLIARQSQGPDGEYSPITKITKGQTLQVIAGELRGMSRLLPLVRGLLRLLWQPRL